MNPIVFAKSLFFIILASGLIACASEVARSNALNNKGQPAWVSLGNGPMQSTQGRLLQGVGSAQLHGMLGQQTTIANERARDALRQVFVSYLEVVSRDFIATEQAQRLKYQRHTALKDIKSIVHNSRHAMRIVGHWQDRTNDRLYAVAELKSTSLKKNIEKLNKVNPEFKAYFLSRSDPIFDRMAGQLD